MAGATATQIFVSHERIGGTCGLVQHKYVKCRPMLQILSLLDGCQ